MPHSYYELYYHFIWTTKKRIALISPEIEIELKKFIPNKISQNKGSCLALDMVSNHIHLLASVAAQISIAEFVNKIKGSSSYHINLITGEKGFYWQNGYGVVSLSKKGIPFVTQYIQSQKQRHKDDDLVAVLENTPMDEELLVKNFGREYSSPKARLRALLKT